MKNMRIKEVLFSEDDIANIVRITAERISSDYKEQNIDSMTLVCVLKGAVMFTADLMRKIELPSIRLEFIKASSYGSSDTSSGEVELNIADDLLISGKNILIVEDIIDTGYTLKRIVEKFKLLKPNTIKVCTLFDKPDRRIVDFKPDYVGSVIPDEFIVGYGLDYAEMYRNLPYVAVLGE